MTIICALHEPGVGTWIGSDRRRVFGGVPADWQAKWDILGGAALGISGNGRAVTVLHRIAPDLLAAHADPHAIYDAMRAALRADGFKPEVKDAYGEYFCAWAIYARADGGIWGISGNGCITPVPTGTFWADGTGDKQAMGAAHALQAGGWPTSALVRRAVEAAIALDHECGGEPFVHLLEAR